MSPPSPGGTAAKVGRTGVKELTTAFLADPGWSSETRSCTACRFAYTLINKRGKHCSVYAGQFHEVHQTAIAEAKTHYATEMPADADIVIANAFYKTNENLIALFAAPSALKNSGGDFVLRSMRNDRRKLKTKRAEI